MEAEPHSAGLMPVQLHEEVDQAITMNVTATMTHAGLAAVPAFQRLPTQAVLSVRG